MQRSVARNALATTTLAARTARTGITSPTPTLLRVDDDVSLILDGIA
jgi:hypothetical protein